MSWQWVVLIVGSELALVAFVAVLAFAGDDTKKKT